VTGDRGTDPQRELYEVADELRAIANLGLEDAVNEYARERYHRVLRATARIVAAVDAASLEVVHQSYADHTSHVSPLAGASAAVFREGRLLLIRRSDNGLWNIPGGLVDVGETLAEAAQRELLEETRIIGVATRLIGVWDSRRVGMRVKQQLFDACFEVVGDGIPVPTDEATEVGFFAAGALPPLSPGADIVVPAVFWLCESAAPTWFD
jgi:ADP-ribose pyrophosphatase YjhB (NUDIX family)